MKHSLYPLELKKGVLGKRGEGPGPPPAFRRKEGERGEEGVFVEASGHHLTPIRSERGGQNPTIGKGEKHGRGKKKRVLLLCQYHPFSTEQRKE